MTTQMIHSGLNFSQLWLLFVQKADPVTQQLSTVTNHGSNGKKLFCLIDDGIAYDIDGEEEFQKFLKDFDTPYLLHNRTHERVSSLASLVNFGTY